MSLKGTIIVYGVGALIASGALFGVYKHVELKGEHKVMAAVEAATTAEHERRMTDLEELQTYYRPYVEALDKSEKHNADLLAQGRVVSPANNRSACLDSASVDRLRAIGTGGQQASGGASKRTGKAARRADGAVQ